MNEDRGWDGNCPSEHLNGCNCWKATQGEYDRIFELITRLTWKSDGTEILAREDEFRRKSDRKSSFTPEEWAKALEEAEWRTENGPE